MTRAAAPSGRSYTKRELQHQHAQQLAKHKRRVVKKESEQKKLEKRRAKFKNGRNLLAFKDKHVAKLVNWFCDVDLKYIEWWQVGETLDANINTDKGHLSTQLYTNETTARNSLLTKLESISQKVTQYLKVERESAEDDDMVLWANRLADDGTIRDRCAAKATLIVKCPMLNSNLLDDLVLHATSNNRTEMEIGLTTFVQVWIKIVPYQRSLYVFNPPQDHCEPKEVFPQVLLTKFIQKREDGVRFTHADSLEHDGVPIRWLMCALTEHRIMHSASVLLSSMRKRLTDSVEHTRKIIYEALLKMCTKPSLRETTLRLFLRCFGDTSSRLVSKLSIGLGELLLKQCSMKKLVAEKIQELIFMQRVSSVEVAHRMQENFGFGHQLVRLRRKTKIVKQKIQQAGIFGSEPKKSRLPYKFTTQAVKFLSEMVFTSDELDSVSDQLKRFLRLLEVFIANTGTPTLKEIRNRQMKDAKKLKKSSNSDSFASSSHFTDESGTFVVGFGLCKSGDPALRYLLTGLRRLIQQIPQTLLDELSDGSKNSGSTLFKLVSQCMRVAHRAVLPSTRVHAWVLSYELAKRLDLTYLVYPNLYAQLRDSKFVHCKARFAWLRLLITILTDTYNCKGETRGALLRRLISNFAVIDNEAAFLPMLTILSDKLQSDESAVKEWLIDDSLKTTHLESEYNDEEFEPNRSQALEAPFWELKLADCHISPNVQNSVKYFRDSLIDGPSCNLWLNDLANRMTEDDEVSTKHSNMSLYKALTKSQSLGTLYRLLQGKPISRSVVKCKKKNVPQDLWSMDIYNKEFWKSFKSSQLQLPFESMLRPTYSRLAVYHLEGINLEKEIDRLADAYVMGCRVDEVMSDNSAASEVETTLDSDFVSCSEMIESDK